MNVSNIPFSVKSLLVAAAFSLAPVAAHAAAVSPITSFLANPVNSDTTNQYPTGGFEVKNLYDANPTPLQVGTRLTTGGEYARQGSGAADSTGRNFVAVYNYGSDVSFNALAFQGRNADNIGGNDQITGLNIYATDTLPTNFGNDTGYTNPTLASNILSGTPNASVTLTEALTGNTQTFNGYDLPTTLAGQYVVI